MLEASQLSGFCHNHALYSPMGGGVGEGGCGPDSEPAGLAVAARGLVLVGVALAKEMAWDEGVLEAALVAMDWGYLVR